MLHSPKRHVLLEFLVENKAFHFTKRVLHGNTAHNKWLKKALMASFFFIQRNKVVVKVLLSFQFG